MANWGSEHQTFKSMESNNKRYDSCPDWRQLPLVIYTGERITGMNSGQTFGPTAEPHGDGFSSVQRKLPPVIYADYREPARAYSTNGPYDSTDPTQDSCIKIKDEVNEDHSSPELGSDNVQTEIINAIPLSFLPPPLPDATVVNHPIRQDKPCTSRRRKQSIYEKLAELEQKEWLQKLWMVEARQRTNGKFDLFFHHRIFKLRCRSLIEVDAYTGNGINQKELVKRDEQLTVASKMFSRNGNYVVSPGRKSVITTAASRPRKLKASGDSELEHREVETMPEKSIDGVLYDVPVVYKF